MSDPPTRILIVDDSALYRQTIHNVLRGMPGVTVVGAARDGREALEKVEQLAPDLLTLDVRMPDMDGIAVLREVRRRRLRAKAIMVSSFTSEGAQVTTDALLTGAFDFILKPSGSDAVGNRERLREELLEKITAFRDARQETGQRLAPRSISRRAVPTQGVAEAATVARSPCRAVLLGASTGGPAAFKIVLPRLPADLGVPVLVVQHMPPKFTLSLAERLNGLSPLDVVEAVHGMKVRASQVLIAPGGYHMGVARTAGAATVQITEDPPENGCRPSVDYLFRSAAAAYQGDVLGVVMTGMGRDGCLGAAAIKEAGGSVFAQDEEGCVVYGMPKAVITAGHADRILPLGKVAAAIVRHVKRSRKPS